MKDVVWFEQCQIWTLSALDECLQVGRRDEKVQERDDKEMT